MTGYPHIAPPASLLRAREASNRIPSPVGERFAAKTKGGTAKVYLYDAIGVGMFETGIAAADVARELDAAQAAGAASLEVYVNSPGGFISDGMSIYAAIRRFNGPKTVYVDGFAASIASVIALAGDRVVTAPGATWMIHQPMGGVMAWGTRSDLADAQQKEDAALASMHEAILDVYEQRTKQPRAKLHDWMMAETWMTAREAMDRGFTHEIQAEEPEARVAAPAPRALTTSELIATARARADNARRLSGASPGPSGQPGTNATQHGKDKKS